MIYQDSRYTQTDLIIHEGKQIFKIRDLVNLNMDNATHYIFKQGDRLDILADKYLGDAQLYWVILDCNPQYMWEGDIQYGDVILIPNEQEVIKWLNQ
jgi:nucleoid-associated protein YgaU